jgi:pimeloyl-ACP methyl ester carboxylesterase
LFNVALRYPHRTWALVIVGAHSEAPTGEYRETLKAVQRTLAREGMEGFRAAFDRAGELPERLKYDTNYANWFNRLFSKNRPESLNKALDAILTMPRLTTRLGEISVPTLAIVGENDLPFLELTSYYERAIPRGQAHVVPGCSHYPMCDQPHDFNEIIGAFLESCRREKARSESSDAF